MHTDLIQAIQDACYHIPQDEFKEIANGNASAYIRGITNGRNQAIEIIKELGLTQ
jgi:hypothetical protein